MRRTLMLTVSSLLLAMLMTVIAWPFAFADDERPGKDRPKRDRKGGDDRPPPPPPPPQHLEKALEDLELTGDQKAKAEKILKAHHDKMRKIMEKARAELLEQMKKVLTKEQYAEFEKATRRGPGRRPDGPPPDGPRGKRRPPKEDDEDRPPPPRGKRPPPPDDDDNAPR